MSHLTPAVSNTDHCAGPDDAPVTLVEYGDYECSYCGSAHPIVLAVRKRMGRRLRRKFRRLPSAPECHLGLLRPWSDPCPVFFLARFGTERATGPSRFPKLGPAAVALL